MLYDICALIGVMVLSAVFVGTAFWAAGCKFDFKVERTDR